ncbi:hypothetical protein [uncultured Methanobrevibacter sp.]|uniref:hypothetical protein n=1 Tax=uncultured Methanobrevibacter sp. TaxID=253161 RepID=UPI0025FFC4A1|nr:hypothetical protein [uncultured Methanobrevibacter sp.]
MKTMNFLHLKTRSLIHLIQKLLGMNVSEFFFTNAAAKKSTVYIAPNHFTNRHMPFFSLFLDELLELFC